MKITDIILTEDNEPDLEALLAEPIFLLGEEHIAAIHKECSEFLDVATSPLYRGSHNNVDRLSKAKIRTDRVPKDSKPETTAAFNYVFEAKFGIPLVRNSAAFVTGDAAVAGEYGNVNLVFPINGTHYAIGDGIEDLYSDALLGMREISQYMHDYVEDVSLRALRGGTSLSELKKAQHDLQMNFDDIRIFLRQRNGLITKDQIVQLFGKHIKPWHDYVDQLTTSLNQYKYYNHYADRIGGASEEIMMFGAPYYYMLPAHSIIKRIHTAWMSGMYDTFVGGEQRDGATIHAHELFNAVKNKQTIHLLPLDDSKRRRG